MQSFLTNLTEFFPNGIIIVSHLQPIKECGDITVQIMKNIDRTSLIKFGSDKIIQETTPTDNQKIYN